MQYKAVRARSAETTSCTERKSSRYHFCGKFSSLNSRAVSGSSASGHARGRCEPSSSKLHRAKCGDGKQVTDDVGSLDAPERGGCKSRLEQIADLLRWSV